jgi:glycosyltransferase involved in cell wall biosynthesis
MGVRARASLVYLGLALFDRFAAARIVSCAPRVVVGVENSCLHTFRRAKAAGAICVLDAASVHHSAQPRDDSSIPSDLHARINHRKDAEIALADRIVVLSNYARDTYVAAGVPIDKLAVIAPGVHLEGASRSGPKAAASGVRFLFAGNVKKAKGIDLLLEAFSRLDTADKRLAIAGPLAEPGVLPDQLPPGVECLGKLERDALFQAYAGADVFVLPSRADGFGFVVAEAMGCGLPVIVSSAVGAADLVAHGENGWIFVSGDIELLRQAMAAAISRRREWPAMGARARQAVEGLTWDAYGERIRAFYRRLLEESAGNRSAP